LVGLLKNLRSHLLVREGEDTAMRTGRSLRSTGRVVTVSWQCADSGGLYQHLYRSHCSAELMCSFIRGLFCVLVWRMRSPILSVKNPVSFISA